MRKYYILLVALLVSACSTSPKYKLEDVPPTPPKVIVPPPPPLVEVERLDRREVIRAIAECEDSGMKPYVEYITYKTEHGKVLVPINVHCDPKRQK
jgi:hypothetical protein